MRPHERHRRARRSAIEKIPLRQIDAVPDLLGNQPARARLRGYRLPQSLGDVAPPGGELVVRAFADQQRPAAADASAVERRAVFMLTVPVAVIAMPDRPGGGLALEQPVDYGNGVDDARIVGGA